MAASDVQHEAMRVYRALVELREDWSGGLVLLCGPGCVNGAAPAAVSIAGGATLAIDSDAAAMKAAMRAGALDFVVNSLDEALRALKNEVRKRRPLGVGLIADVDATLVEMAERGVQPDLHIVPSGYGDLDRVQLATLRERGMTSFVAAQDSANAGSIAALLLSGKRYCECFFFAATDAAELASLDAALLAVIGGDDLVRRRWIEGVPRYLREARSGGRWIWLSGEERASLGDLTS